MRTSKLIAVSLLGLLLILGACGGAAPADNTSMPGMTTTTDDTSTTPPTGGTPATKPTTTNPTGPANFVLSNLSVVPDHAAPVIEYVQISVRVTNTGGQSGTYTAVLKVNGQPYGDPKKVTLAGGESQTVAWAVNEPEEGKYTFTIGDLSGSFLINDVA